ncbi:MAG: tetratricopeptide repeat protein [Burkholderiaceae bacterium]|jgi:hypothetical protein|nr:tetratricopeptide repeat protein [Burkholderiaceae bacterium]
MFRKIVTGLILAASMVAASAWAASPTVDQVYQAAKAGNYAQAQSMMDEVLREHPDSAKAHFVQAELLAGQGKLAAARGELNTAQRFDPNLSFARPAAVQALKSRLGAPSGSAQVRQQPAGSILAGSQRGGISWGPIIILVVVVALVLMFLRSRRPRAFGNGMGSGMMPGGPAGPMGYGPGGAAMMPPQAGGGMGSGIMGSLATGAAVGAGMIAGESLMHKVLGDGSQRQILPANDTSNNDTGNYDMGGNDFGLNDTGSWDGGGSDSWDGGGGGSDDWN